ncbi:MAG: hypothetical protein ABIH83_02780 [Candidatus Micrarchaeota archaeon]
MDINDAFKNTCRVLLGEEIGELKEYEDYLSKYVEKPYKKKSAISQRDIVVSPQHYCKNSKFISNDEMPKYAEIIEDAKFDINKIKDIDSILGQLSEKLYYSGNIVIGNSREVLESDSCANSQYVYKSIRIYDSKFVAYSSDVRYGENIFGCDKVPPSKFLISACHTHKSVRCMETLTTIMCSDCYYSAHLEECYNCLFSFNQKSRRNLIGNVQFTKEEYGKIKSKLLEDMKEMLKSKKSVPSIMDIISGKHA